MKFILFYYIIAVLATFIVLYLYNPKPEIILKYPNVNNNLSDLYVDNRGTCYRYKTKEVNCNLLGE